MQTNEFIQRYNQSTLYFLDRSIEFPLTSVRCSVRRPLLALRLWILGVLACSLLASANRAFGIDPVRPGDQVEVLYSGKWYSGVVLEYSKNKARVSYTYIGDREGVFAITDMRFPNNEGHWMTWSDATGAFKLNARLVGRTATHVTLKKVDGSTVEVPIEKLAKKLQLQLSKIADAEKKFVDAALVRVDDQVEYKSVWGWYPAVVNTILPDGAQITISDFVAKTSRVVDAKYADMRYPNGEGPWADWTDITGKHTLKARYLTHDSERVWLLREGSKKVAIERTKLAKQIEEELRRRPILARRPEEIAFDTSAVDFTKLPSNVSFGASTPPFPSAWMKITPTVRDADVTISNGFFELPFPSGASVESRSRASSKKPKVRFVPTGTARVICFSVTPAEISPYEATTLYWLNLETMALSAGPSFFDNEIPIGYSPDQQRLITTTGVKDKPNRYCSYQLEPWQAIALPEKSWGVPELTYVWPKPESTITFFGESQALIGYSGTINLWDIEKGKLIYTSNSTDDYQGVSPDLKYIFTDIFFRGVVLDAATGEPVAHRSNFGGKTVFSSDGTYFAERDHWGLKFHNLNSRRTIEKVDLPSFEQFAIPDEEWIVTDNMLWNQERKMRVWSNSSVGLQNLHTRILGEHLLQIATDAESTATPSLYVSVSDLIFEGATTAFNTISDEELFVIRPGIRVRIDDTITHPKILPGVRRALDTYGWIEDESSDIVIKATATRAETVTREFQKTVSRMHRIDSTGGEKITLSAAPWYQNVWIEQNKITLWQTGLGGMPFWVQGSDVASLQQAVRECEQESYSLFENVQYPEKVMAPKYKNGLGMTILSKDGIEHKRIE